MKDKLIPTESSLPTWLTYRVKSNDIFSEKSQENADKGCYIIRVFRQGEVTLEKIKLQVGVENSEEMKELLSI